MVNGNYVLYGDKPSSESEIVDDHVHKRTVDRKTKRRSRTANELQRSLNVRQLDNETDSVKYEKKINEPRLLRYVPTTDVEENYVTEKFETYDLKPTEERPRKYAFTKKPKNPTDGSINYAYSRSSSSCSSPNGNLPTISEHGEQYGNYRVHSFSGAVIDDVVTGYETKLDKYFSKPREVKTFAAKGSHPDSLYRVPVDSGVARTKMTRVVRVIRWPAALVAVCVALAVFVYFLMPDTIDIDVDSVNGTTWEAARAHNNVLPHKFEESKVKKNDNDRAQTQVPQCHSTHIPLCRGVLPYDLAGNAASVGGIEITALLPQIEYLVATNCSDRVRHFVCALLEPECNPPPYPPKLPCFNLCKAIVDNCDGLIPRDLSPAFNCQQYFKNNCIAAKTPCYPREMMCGDGSCIPRDWICDGTRDCLSGEDEATCVQCDNREFRCPSGGCIQKRWLCDGYADCSNGEDEDVEVCGSPVVAGEEPAGSAPAPAVRRPNRMQNSHGRQYSHNTGENESSKELLVTSDSSNSLKRNFTRRPSLSRLTPYNRNMPHTIQTRHNNTQTTTTPSTKHSSQDNERTTQNADDGDSEEDVNVGDLGFFEDLKREPKEQPAKRVVAKSQMTKPKSSIEKDAGGGAPAPTRLDQSISKLERVINGAALLKKAEAESKSEKAEELEESPEMNKGGTRSDDLPTGPRGGSTSAHVSPCPTGELRCVDGRCITLAQLCDGTIDCSDHADEDNCFT